MIMLIMLCRSHFHAVMGHRTTRRRPAGFSHEDYRQQGAVFDRRIPRRLILRILDGAVRQLR